MAEETRSRLWLMRHGEAGSARIDAERPLSERGRMEVSRMAAWFAETCFGGGTAREPNRLRILASPYRRAQQTASLMAKPLGIKVETLEIVTPEDAIEPVIDWLMSQPAQDRLVISHMPLVAELTGRLVEGDGQARAGFPTAAIASLEAEVWAAGCAYLQGFHTPDNLA